MSEVTHHDDEKGIATNLSVPESIFNDPVAFIRQVHNGISGQVVVEAIDALGDRDLFVRLLETTSGNLHRYYKRKALGRTESEEVLDTLAVMLYAARVFEDDGIAREWLHCNVPALSSSRPIDLLDTFRGRQLVREVLGKIEHGEFS